MSGRDPSATGPERRAPSPAGSGAGRLDGRTALVTGGGAGIGGATSRRLAELGAEVVVVDVDEGHASATVDAIAAAGGRAHAVIGDVTDPGVVDELVARGLEVGDGCVDVLVNNVGDFRPTGRFFKSEEAAWQHLYEGTLLHVLRCTRGLLPAMIQRGRGAVVNVSTVEAYRGIPAHTVYSAFNAAVSAFTRSLAVEVGRHGVRVNAIAPDLTDTLQTPAEMMLRGRDPELLRAWVPLGRFGQPEDCADVIAFLVGDEARFVTGHTIPVDGGTLAASGWFGRADGRGWTNLPDQP